MGKNNLTFWSMFENSLFNRQKNMFVFIFISQISYNQMGHWVKHGMEWNGMNWNGMVWNGMEWIGMEWNFIRNIFFSSQTSLH